MPMFPTRRYSMANIPGVTPIAPATDPYDPLQTGQRRRRRGLGGLFDGPARGILRREDGDPGTLLNYALFGLGGVETMRDRAQERELFPFAVRREKLEQGQMEREQASSGAIEEAIAQLPPEQQAWARLNPEAFARAMAERQGDGGWEVGQGYSHAFRTNPDGTVTLGDPLPLRPRAPIQGYVMPNDLDEWDYADE